MPRPAWCLVAVFIGAVSCVAVHDTVLSDVERNYTRVGFLDTDTFQVRCELPAEGSERLAQCHETLLDTLVQYKENYEREAAARRMHADFMPFFEAPPINPEQRAGWRRFYEQLVQGKTRLVFERRLAGNYEGVYRLRLPGLIYRVQKAS
ncbi:MAG: hypothetical protein N2Z22_11165 [Turneriella sp.]|nr:hypothetical protein [Turneriella sp.]